MDKYYDNYADNYCIPIKDFTKELEQEVKEFLKAHRREYFLLYLSEEDGYECNMWCVTSWLE